MQNINSLAELKNAIQILEIEKTEKGQQLKEQLYTTIEGFKPINLLKSSLKDIVTSPLLLDNLIGTTVGLASGLITKKAVTGKSGNLFKKLLGSILQLSVTEIVAKHPDTIKLFGKYVYQIFSPKKKMKSKSRD